MLMIILMLAVYGVALGSFVNALVWRIHAQSKETAKKSPNSKQLDRLSISKGRSMCPHCKHELAAKDLVPVFSWLSLRGKCRYCKAPISVQYPIVELITGALFVASYLWWPNQLQGLEVGVFVLWLALLVGLIALLVYDLRWMLLPDRLVFPLTGLAALQALVAVTASDRPVVALINVVAAVAVGGGLFYVLFQVSAGKWIGGGDVKLGWLLGLSVGTPAKALLFIFLAALLGSLVSIPLVAVHKLKGKSVIPFGPFLIIAAIVTQLFGTAIIHWYRVTLIGL
ncbi:MAG: hypothetical protein JWO41_41 [Candidatus Saccharibacteria bacterium]|nr:hypothetical protein [Candidatus Saccharibacteria bacterium]